MQMEQGGVGSGAVDIDGNGVGNSNRWPNRFGQDLGWTGQGQVVKEKAVFKISRPGQFDMDKRVRGIDHTPKQRASRSLGQVNGQGKDAVCPTSADQGDCQPIQLNVSGVKAEGRLR